MTYIVRRPSPEMTHSHSPFHFMRHLTGWDPFQEMSPYTPLTAREPLPVFAPQFDVRETKDAFIFKADLPGVEEKSIDVSLTGNRLTVSGLRDEEERQEGDNFFTCERSFGNFTRSFTLPEGIDADHVNAELKGGVLTLRIPKKPENQPKKIAVKVAEQVKGLFSRDTGTA